MQAIVMAAGEGRRLRPLTERWPKPILPIDGKPVLATLLHELAAAGFERATVVTGYRHEQIEALLRGFPLELRFVRQVRPDGSADAARRGLERAPALVVAADTVFEAGDVGRFVERARGADAAIAVRREPAPDPPARYATRVERGLVTKVLDTDVRSPLSGAPLWWLAEPVTRLLDTLHGPPYELSEALQRAIDTGLAVRGVEIGPTRDLTHPVDLIVENFPYLGGT